MLVVAYSEDQPRDSDGKFGSGDGAGVSAEGVRSERADTTNTHVEINCPGMPPEIEARVRGTMQDLQAKYTVGPTKVAWFGGKESYAKSGKDTILLSPYYWQDAAKIAAVDKDWDRMRVTGIEGTIAHEYGHQLEQQLLRDDRATYEATVQPAADAARSPDGKQTTSVYGEENSGEHCAEAFAMHYIGTDNIELSGWQYPDVKAGVLDNAAQIVGPIDKAYRR